MEKRETPYQTDYYFLLTPQLAQRAKELGLIFDHIPVIISEPIPDGDIQRRHSR